MLKNRLPIPPGPARQDAPFTGLRSHIVNGRVTRLMRFLNTM